MEANMEGTISLEVIMNVWFMLQRAKLTRSQAADYFADGTYAESQYNSVITQMHNVEHRCKSIIGSIRFTGKVYKIPESLIEDANKISKSFIAISKLDKIKN